MEDKLILNGVKFDWENGSYSGCKNTKELINKFGEPKVVGNKSFWEITDQNDKLIIISTIENVEIYLK